MKRGRNKVESSNPLFGVFRFIRLILFFNIFVRNRLPLQKKTPRMGRLFSAFSHQSHRAQHGQKHITRTIPATTAPRTGRCRSNRIPRIDHRHYFPSPQPYRRISDRPCNYFLPIPQRYPSNRKHYLDRFHFYLLP